jgi:sialate O-acetylesterase
MHYICKSRKCTAAKCLQILPTPAENIGFNKIMRRMKKIGFLKFCIVFFICNSAFAEVRLPKMVRDSMVLQRNARVKIWGWATKGEKITVSFAGRKYRTIATSDGKWLVTLTPTKAGGPFNLNIDATNHLSLKDVLVGDVWLCSGQSNMVHQMQLHNVLYAEDIAKANYPEIRHFWIANVANLQGPQDDLPGGFWKWANPNDVNQFSAVSYFFARKVYEKYKVPIGLINASWGGAPIEAWTSEEGLKEFPDILSTVQKNKDSAYINDINRRALSANKPFKVEDKGLTPGSVPWYDPSYVPKGWRPISIPGYWEDQGIRDIDGVVWYRREIDIPAAMTTVSAKIFLGRIVDADVLYVNGKQVGNTTYMYPQRRYTLPLGTLKPGKNLFVVRVTNNGGKGGFVPDKPYKLIAGNDTIDLTGYWQYKVGQVIVGERGARAAGIAAQNQPTALYNSMIAPLLNYSVKGFLWYQGEANAAAADQYSRLQPAMIADWRSKWRQPNAPFLFVQLPNFMEMNYQPMESQWAAFREAQLQSLSIPHTGMAVAIDLGEWNDIHPDRKKEVGERLALAAMKVAYGDKSIVSSGPLYQSAKVDGNKIIISFTNTGSGLVTNDAEEPAEFAIAGADKKFVWAKAKIEGDKVVVWNDDIINPIYVRYAWADNPVNANVYNREGLPASPFRTDSTAR